MRRQRSLALFAVIALCGSLGACGSDDELSTQVPKTSPDLTIPTGTTQAPPADTSTTGTTSTTDTSTAPDATQQVSPPAAVTPPPVATPPPAATGSPQTGGQTPQTTGQSTTGGAQAGGGEFENFCAQNPGAC
jgi:hypothetical protein